MSCPDWIQHIPFDIYFYVLQKMKGLIIPKGKKHVL